MPSIFIRDNPIFSSERMLHQDYYRRSAVEKKSPVVGLKGLDAKTN
jgi:20S proteasome alpha/beta subunit